MQGAIPLFTCFLALVLLANCGSVEDPDTETTLPLMELSISTWQTVSDAEIAELREINVPDGWHWDSDPTASVEQRLKIRQAQLLKEFGDIPQVRTLIEFDKNSGKPYGYQKQIQLLEVYYFLWPTETNRRSLEDARKNPPQESAEDLDKLMIENPRLYIKIQRERFIKNFGDIPEVHIYLDLLEKSLLGQRLTNAERQTMQAAMNHLLKLDRGNE